MTKAQQYCNRLMQLGLREYTEQTSRYRAFQHPTMRADQYVLVGKNGSLRTGSVSATSLALKPETFFELLTQRVA